MSYIYGCVALGAAVAIWLIYVSRANAGQQKLRKITAAQKTPTGKVTPVDDSRRLRKPKDKRPKFGNR